MKSAKNILDEILSDSSQDEDQTQFTINKEFAAKYEHSKQKQELAILREKHGDVKINSSQSESSDSDDSDENEPEDEIADEMTPAIDVELMKTIAAIRSKDPSVYDPNTRFFKEETIKQLDNDAEQKQLLISNSQLDSSKPLTLREYQKQAMLEEFSGKSNQDPVTPVKTHSEEQEELRQELIQSIKASNAKDDEMDEEYDNLFSIKQKSETEKSNEEADYRTWLLNNLKTDEHCAKVFPGIGNQGQSSINEEDQFLTEFILNRGWIDQKKQEANEEAEIIDRLDEELDPIAEEFEHRYNFRYEQLEEGNQQPDAQQSSLFGITTHARDIPDSVRRKDTSRAEKRLERQQRKEAEKQKKLEEIKRLKNLKRKEMNEMIEKIQRWSGMNIDAEKEGDVDQKRGKLETVIANMEDDDDFDISKWDEVMNQMFGDDYYKDTENVKPQFSDNEDEGGNLDEYQFAPVKNSNRNKGEDEDEDEFCMDADYLPDGDNYEENTVDQQTPPSIEELQQLKEEYDQLDYEDIVSGIPTRFRYRQVEKDDFGLKPDEVLKADDSLLNSYISLKRLAPYRTRVSDRKWLDMWKRNGKKRRKELRRKLKELKAEEEKVSESTEQVVEEAVEAKPKKEKKEKSSKDKDSHKKRSRSKKSADSPSLIDELTTESVHEKESDPKKKKRKRTELQFKKDRLSSYGL